MYNRFRPFILYSINVLYRSSIPDRPTFLTVSGIKKFTNGRKRSMNVYRNGQKQ